MLTHFHVCIEGKLRDGHAKWCNHCDRGRLRPKGLPPNRIHPRLALGEALMRLNTCECGASLTEENEYWKCNKCAAAWLKRGAQLDRGRRNRTGYWLGEEEDNNE